MTYTLHDRVVSLILVIEAWIGLAYATYAMWAGGFTYRRGAATTIVVLCWVYAREWRAMVTR